MNFNLKRTIAESRKGLFAGSFILTAAMSGSAASATTYYMSTDGSDSNPGTLSNPFATLAGANWKMVAGDTLAIEGGTYNLTAHQTLTGKGTAAAPEVIVNYAGQTVIFDGTGLPAKTDEITIQGQYLTVRGIVFRNSPKDGLVDWGGQHITIANCIIYNCQQSGVLAEYSTAGVTSDLTVSGCMIHNCMLANYPATGYWAPALYVAGATNVTATGNTVYGNFGEGIDFSHCTNSTMNHNTIFDNYSVEAYLDNGVQCDVSDNLIYSTGNPMYFRNGLAASGIQCGVEPSSTCPTIGLHNCTVLANYVVNCGTGFYYGNYGLGGGMHDCTIENNTFYKCPGGCPLFLQPDSHSNNKIAYNILCQTNGGSMVYDGAKSGFTCSNNCWYGGASGGKTYAGAGDLNANPKFVSPGVYSQIGYALAPGSPCIIGKMGATSGHSGGA